MIVESIDLLYLLYVNKISEDHAYDLLDEQMEKFHDGLISEDWAEFFHLDRYEATASCHGLGLAAIAKLRYEGWPTICMESGQVVNYREYGWMFVVVDESNRKEGIEYYDDDMMFVRVVQPPE